MWDVLTATIYIATLQINCCFDNYRMDCLFEGDCVGFKIVCRALQVAGLIGFTNYLHERCSPGGKKLLFLSQEGESMHDNHLTSTPFSRPLVLFGDGVILLPVKMYITSVTFESSDRNASMEIIVFYTWRVEFFVFDNAEGLHAFNSC